MTTRPNAKSPPTGAPAAVREMLPDPTRPRYTMQQEVHITDIRTILRQHYAHRPDVLVSGDGYLCYDTRVNENWLVPDCVVAFGVDTGAIFRQNGYVTRDVGKPPDLVVEVASKSTGAADRTRKRRGYALHQVREYWRFDATGGDFHGAPLAGDRLVDGEYQPMPLNYEPDGMVWGHSPTLGLDLCWDRGRLRFYDPAAGRYLRDMATAEAERETAVAERETAAAERDAAETRAAAAEAEKNIAETRAAEAEAELRLLREQLRRRAE